MAGLEFDAVVIGAGIAGLNIAHQLHQKPHERFLVLDKSRLSNPGRVQSDSYQGQSFERGAAVFHSHQRSIMKLIKDLNFTDNLVESKSTPENIWYFDKQAGHLDSQVFSHIFDALFDRLEETARREPGPLSVQDVAAKALSADQRRLFQLMEASWREIKDQNCHTYFRDEDAIKKIYVLRGGLSQITKKLADVLRDHIRRDEKVLSITNNTGKGFVIRTSKQTYTSSRVYLCTDVTSARAILYHNIVNMAPLLKRLGVHSTLRFYVSFKSPVDEWFPPRQIVTNWPFTWSMKLGPRLLLISYVDDEEAWRFKHMGVDSSFAEIMIHLGRTLEWTEAQRVEIEANVDKKWFLFWPESYSVIDANLSRRDLNKLLRGLPRGFIQTVVPKDFGRDQAWMETHLIDI